LTVYADTSFLVPLYLFDRHTMNAETRMTTRPTVLFTPFHRAELTHAIYQHVFRRHISDREAQLAFLNLEQDVSGGLWTLADQPLTVLNRCIQLAHKHVASLGVRTLDSMHVAAALELGATHFWTFDQRQARLAEVAGLVTS
jgi:predicted nucleic acid-binding protein